MITWRVARVFVIWFEFEIEEILELPGDSVSSGGVPVIRVYAGDSDRGNWYCHAGAHLFSVPS